MKLLSLLLLALLLQACGGGSSDAPPEEPLSPQSCSVTGQRQAIRDFMQEQYYWYRNLGTPDDTAAGMDGYFRSMLYQPVDRFSFTEPTASYQQRSVEGRRVGYGYTLVWGNDVTTLRLRSVEPLGPVALAGLKRGDSVLAIDGYTPAEIAAGLLPAVTSTGVARTLTIATVAGGWRDVTVVSEDFALRPVMATAVLDAVRDGLPVKVGYLAYEQFAAYSMDEVRAAFARFAAEPVTEVILDLRYNGGGSVLAARDLASLVGAWSTAGMTFTSLRFSDKQAARNGAIRFAPQDVIAGTALAAGLPRVFVISSGSTASASELVINGLKPFLDVVLVGETTYGKPYGFVPYESCGTTYQAVQFDTVNSVGEGGYVDGIRPDCEVADDLDHALGDPQERSISTALNYLATGRCSADAVPQRELLPRSIRRPPVFGETWPGGMTVD